MFDRDEQETSQIIETGLEAILSGRETLEQVIAEYPDQAEILRPELESALWLVNRQTEIAPRPGFVAASRKRVVDQIRQESKGRATKRAFFGLALPRLPSFQWVAVVLLLVVLLSGTGGLIGLSQAAMPGDGLYGVKRFSEQVAYTVTINDVQRVELSAQFADRRLQEVEELMAKGDFASAKPILAAYDQQLNQSVALLQEIDNSQAHEKREAAMSLKEDLDKHAGRLAALQAAAVQASAPTDVRASLQEAMNVTADNKNAADEVLKRTPDTTATPSPSPTGTITPTVGNTPTPLVNPTEAPPALVESPQPTLSDTDLTSTPSPTGTPTNEEKLTKTPKPTNENRPPKVDPGAPAKDQPPKEKPPKEHTPPGKDK